MEGAGLLDLPDELVLHLSHYLAVRDILSCCLVCRRLRQVLNDDEVWRRRVPSQAVSRLEAREQLVAPRLPPVLGSVGEQRRLYAATIRLMHNWRSGNCVEIHSTSTNKFSNLTCQSMGLTSSFTLLYSDRYLFVGRSSLDSNFNAVSVWDVGNVPELYATVQVNNIDYGNFLIIGSKLVIVECVKVIVYEITLPERGFPLLYSFFIDTQAVTFGREVDEAHCHCENRCDNWRRLGCCSDRCYEWRHQSVDQYLISQRCIFYDFVGSAVQVWDISTGTKVGSFLPPQPGYEIVFNCKVDDKWYFYQSQRGDELYTLLEFDISKDQTLYPVLSYKGHAHPVIIFNNTAILFHKADKPWYCQYHDLVCTVHDLSTSMEIRRRRFDHSNRDTHFFLKSIVVFDGKFIVLCQNSFHVVDAWSLETMDQFPCGDERVSYISHQFKVFNSLFVLTARKKHCLELWDVENKRKVFCNLKMHSYSHVFVNDSSSALVYFGYVGRHPKVSVVHFW